MDKFLNIMKLNDEEDDYYDDDYYDEEEDEPIVEKKSTKIKNINRVDPYEEEEKPKKSSSAPGSSQRTAMTTILGSRPMEQCSARRSSVRNRWPGD